MDQKKIFFIPLVFFLFQLSFAANIDSLERRLPFSSGEERLRILNKIAYAKRKQNPDSVILMLGEAFELGTKSGNKKELSFTANILGICYSAIGKPDSALHFYNISLENATLLKDTQSISYLYSNIGNIYRKSGNFSKALDYYLNSVRLCEQIGYKNGLTSAFNNIGLVYDDMGNNEIALEYYNKSLDLAYTLNDTDAISRAYSNIAISYNEMGKPELSLEYDLKSLELDRAVGDIVSESISLVNIGVYYYDKSDLETAEKYYNQAYEIKLKLNDKKGLANLLSNISLIHSKKGDKKKAEKFLLDALEIAIDSKLSKQQSEIYRHLAELSENIDNGKSLMFFKKYAAMKDSLFNAETAKQFSDMERKHVNEKMENEIKLLTKEKQLSQAEKKKNSLWMIFISSFLFLVLVFSVVVFISYRNKQKANLQIIKQRDQIENINREVFSSIRYAKRIQDALLKEEEHVSRHLPEHFVLYKPKDILSGDFYWSFERQGLWYVAVADCTGHGVPGAMMSMLGIAFLNEISSFEQLHSPAEMLNLLREKIIVELSQSAGEKNISEEDQTEEKVETSAALVKDGMDISLCCFNLKNRKLSWAGANNPLLIIRKNITLPMLQEIKPDKQPVGFFEKRRSFTNHEIELETGDCFYLFSDGYADQFGGEKGKKFKYSQLKNTFLAIHQVSMESQKQKLVQCFDSWKQDYEQVDDVCIIGVKIS